MNDDFNKLRPGDDEPEKGDDSLDWLNALDDSTPEADESADNLPPAQADNPLAWLDSYAAPGESQNASDEPPQSETPDWLQSDDLFGEDQSQPDWMQNSSDFDDSQNPTAPSSPTDPLPPWLSEQPADETASVPDADLFAGLDEALGLAQSGQPEASTPEWLQADETPEEANPIQDTNDFFARLGAAPPAKSSSAPQQDTPEWLQADETSEEANPMENTDDFFARLGAAPPAKATPAPSDSDDFFAQFNEPAPADEGAGAADVDDIFAQFDTSAPQSTGASDVDDIFGQFDEPIPADDEQPAVPAEDDFLSGLKLTDTGSSDWFVEEEKPAAAEAAPDWLQNLGDLSQADEEPAPAAPQAEDEPAAVPAEDDFLKEMFGDLDATPASDFAQKSAPLNIPQSFDAPGLQDIDSLLASYESAPVASSADNTNISDDDFDRLFSDDEVETVSNLRSGEGRQPISGLSPDAPEWLTEIGASVGSIDEVSAAALVRKQSEKERSVDDLSDRLMALHEAGMELQEAGDAGSPEVIKSLLPGINQVIAAPTAPLTGGQSGIIGEVALSDEQRDKLKLLRSLVAVDEEKPRQQRPAAIDLTLDSSNLDDFAEAGEAPEEAAPAAAVPVAVPRRRARIKLDRILISLIVAAAVILPFFVSSLRVGNLPPAQFTAGSRQQAAYDRVNALGSGQLVLVAAEYGPTGAAELDSALDAILRHILMRGARPVLVSGNPVGLLHAQDVLGAIGQDSAFMTAIHRAGKPLQINSDYYVSRYLVGEAVGLRDFGQNLASLLGTDINGQAMKLSATSLHDFSAIIVIAERSEDVRAWGEQIAPLAGQPLIIASGYSAAPLAEPYALPAAPGALAGIGGLLIGYQDAYTYRQMVDGALFGITPTAPPSTAVPTTNANAPEATATVEQGSAPISATGTAAIEAVQTALPGATTVTNPTAAPPTVFPTVSGPTLPAPATVAETAAPPTESSGQQPATATLPPSAPTEGGPTAQPTTPPIVVQAVIKSNQAVNVRSGPATTFAPVTSVQPGAVVQVIGRNGDQSWIQIQLTDGTQGWVSAQLIDIQEPTIEPSPTREGAFVDPNAMAGLLMDSSYADAAQQKATATPKVTASPEATAEATGESTAEATGEATSEATAGVTAAPTIAPTNAPPPETVIAGLPATFAYRDERWYGMTLGLVAIILVITLAALVNIVRGLVRRGK